MRPTLQCFWVCVEQIGCTRSVLHHSIPLYPALHYFTLLQSALLHSNPLPCSASLYAAPSRSISHFTLLYITLPRSNNLFYRALLRSTPFYPGLPCFTLLFHILPRFTPLLRPTPLYPTGGLPRSNDDYCAVTLPFRTC